MFLLLIVLSFTPLDVKATDQDFIIPEYCVEGIIPDDFSLAYRGWPYKVECSLVMNIMGDYSIYDWAYESDSDLPFDQFLVQCTIINATSSRVLFNKSASVEQLIYFEDEEDIGFLTPDVYDDSPQFIVIVEDIPGSNCVYVSLTLNVTDVEETTCNDEIQPGQTRHHDSHLYSRKEFSCTLGLNEYPKINVAQELVTYQWYHDCSTNLPSNVELIDDSSGPKLIIEKLDFENAGSYICGITYKGMTKFIPQYDVCISHRRVPADILLECDNDKISANVGENTTLTCTATLGQGNFRDDDIIVELQKLINETHTYTIIPRCTEESNQDNINCTFYNPHDVCYHSFSSDEQRTSPRTTVRITFTFANIQKTDYGEYFVVTKLLVSNEPRQNITFILQPNPIPGLLSQAAVAGICIGILFAFLIFMFIVLWNSVYIRVYYKVFFGVYELDNKDYGAMLVYNFSTCDLDKFAREKVQSTVPKIRKLLESFGYAVYDENSDGTVLAGRADNISVSIERSHRVVVFLSSDLIHNEWSMLAFHTGFREMIHSGSKLIFILLPGIRAYLKQHAKENDSCALLLRAIKLNHAIDLPKDVNERRFQYQVRDAMPKLRGRPRSVSTISSNCSVPDYQNINFHRCFSNETQTTEIEMPAGIHVEGLQIIEEQGQETYDDTL